MAISSARTQSGKGEQPGDWAGRAAHIEEESETGPLHWACGARRRSTNARAWAISVSLNLGW
jgi:hypothetical protein